MIENEIGKLTYDNDAVMIFLKRKTTLKKSKNHLSTVRKRNYIK